MAYFKKKIKKKEKYGFKKGGAVKMAKMDKHGFFTGRGSKQKADKITRFLNKSFKLTGGKYKAITLKSGKSYTPLIEKKK
ncbi:MAG: hypothetical protein GY777_27795 [Candidatus Brocadiaceae bacterium]|jgi:acid phosphatase class B|nr:hypothetical protein [Candidatus Brocadiaceae bacterium]